MSSSKDNPPITRRIVTTHDAQGKAVVWLDGPATNHRFLGDKVTSTLMWVTDCTPADFTVQEDAGTRVLGTAPPANGTRFAVIEFKPGNELSALHRTDTIDYVICISGEIDMEMDDSTVRMKAGDVMIQRGTNHGWVNRGSVPARVAFVLIDGQPKRSNSVTGTRSAPV